LLIDLKSSHECLGNPGNLFSFVTTSLTILYPEWQLGVGRVVIPRDSLQPAATSWEDVAAAVISFHTLIAIISCRGHPFRIFLSFSFDAVPRGGSMELMLSAIQRAHAWIKLGEQNHKISISTWVAILRNDLTNAAPRSPPSSVSPGVTDDKTA